jgi:hypothetical protein
MYNPNQVNSLYFYPHTLHFSPVPEATDSEQRNRWFPSYKASAASMWAKTPVAGARRAPERDSRNSDKIRQGMDDARMDDDGAPIQAAPSEIADGRSILVQSPDPFTPRSTK